MKHETINEFNNRIKTTRCDIDLINFKQSEEFYNSLKNYINYVIKSYRFLSDVNGIQSNILNNMFCFDLCEYPIFIRIKKIEEKFNLKDILKYTNISNDYLSIYKDYFSSYYFINTYKYPYRRKELLNNLNKEILNYEDYQAIKYIEELLI